MSQLWLTILTIFGTLLAAYLGYWLTGKPRLYVFSPASTPFQLEPPQLGAEPIQIRAGQVMVQNAGRRSATKLEVMAGAGPMPWGYNLVPNINHQIKTGPRGEWLMEVPYLGPGETITLQILNGPVIDSIRSAEGPARVIDVMHQRAFPKWFRILAAAVMLVGLGTIGFGILTAIRYTAALATD
jgi:hypothetical protein